MSASRLPLVTSARSIRPASKSSRLMLIASSSVVIHDLDVPRRAFAPLKADPPLATTPIRAVSFEARSLRSLAPQDDGVSDIMRGDFRGYCRGLDTVILAPRDGFEPSTNRLTAGCSTAELPGSKGG